MTPRQRLRQAARSAGRGVLLAAIALAATGAIAAGQACPATRDGRPLSTAQVLDGPVADNAILAPDTGWTRAGVDVATWQVAYVYEAGRQVTLDCRYDGVAEPVVVRIETPVMTCRYSGSRRHGVALRCR